MIQIQIDKNRAECADLQELIFFCQSAGFAQHVADLKRLHKLAQNRVGDWVSDYRPFVTAQFKNKNHPDFGPQQLVTIGETVARGKLPAVVLGVRIVF